MRTPTAAPRAERLTEGGEESQIASAPSGGVCSYVVDEYLKEEDSQ